MTTESATCFPAHPLSTILGANPDSTALGAKNSQVFAVSGTTTLGSVCPDYLTAFMLLN